MILLAGVCVQLGMWQFERLDERTDENAIVKEHLDKEPVPIDDVIGPEDDEVPVDNEWTPVTVSGTYDPEHQVVEKYQTRDSGPGVEIVTPLVTDAGTAVLVNRGWMESENNTASVDEIPAPEDGQVTVTGWLRVDSGADAGAVEPSDGQVRAVSSEGIETALPYDAFPGYVNVTAQELAPASPLEPEPRPDLGQGPHFFYGLQWFFFATLAVFGWFYFAWTEARPRSARRNNRNESTPTTQANTAPSATDDERLTAP